MRHGNSGYMRSSNGQPKKGKYIQSPRSRQKFTSSSLANIFGWPVSMHIIKLLFVLFPFTQADNAQIYTHQGDARTTLEECKKELRYAMETILGCDKPDDYTKPVCIIDISGFSQTEVSDLFNHLLIVRPHIKCDSSTLLELNFGNLQTMGHKVNVDNQKFKSIEDNKPAMVIVNNMHLKTIDFGKKILKEYGVIEPGFWTIQNNPRVTRYSIDTINAFKDSRVNKYGADLDINKDLKVFPNSIKMQNYGECNFKFTNSTKTSLSWEEFRWCRTISHEVILDGPNFNPNNDTAYIHKINGTLKITNTNIENLNFLPVYFAVNSDGNEISGNKKLCVSFEDEIRFTRLGFKIQNNADISCRTTCNSNGLSQQEVLRLKDCVTLKGGLKLDGIDESAAAADLFKTVKVIEGSLEIKNAKATIDFRKLEKITGGSDEKNIFLEGCSHPILFPSLKTLEGTRSVQMEDCRMDAYKFLKEEYKESIVDLSRVVTTTTNAPTAAPDAPGPSPPNAVDGRTSLSSVVVTDKETTVQPVGNHESTKTQETGSLTVSMEPESSTERQGTTHPYTSNMAQVGKGNTSDIKGEDESTSGSSTTLMIIAGLAGAVFLLTSVAIAVIFLKCSVF